LSPLPNLLGNYIPILSSLFLSLCKKRQISSSIKAKGSSGYRDWRRKKMISNKPQQEKRTMGIRKLRNVLHHHLNSLHVYCRLVRFMSRAMAKKVVVYWENTAVYRLMYISL
jgi:hypothetical protein